MAVAGSVMDPVEDRAGESRPRFAGREVGLVAALVGVVLLAVSGRYGYHRDELYFLAAGRHLAWGYPDQPPLVPLLARLADTLAPGSLVALRLPATVAAATDVALTGLLARELGADRRGQVVAAGSAALCSVVLVSGHLLSTTTIALVGWTVLTLLLVRILAGRGSVRSWLTAGLAAGLTLQANPLVGAFLVVLVLALLVVGPRALLRTPGPWLAALLAGALAAPYLLWQAGHGFPQLDVARAIAGGDSATSASRWSFLPMQLLMVGPALAPFWLTGLVRLLRTPALRALGASWVGLAVLFLVAGGKPYYLAGLYPLLLAAGAQPVVDAARRWVPAVLLAGSAPVVLVGLPVLPPAAAGPMAAVNPDAVETIGWPDFVAGVARAYAALPDPATGHAVVLAGNYGEAGAIDRYGAAQGLPRAFSGHLGYAAWGPPPATATAALAVGIDPATLREVCARVEPLGHLTNRWGIDNEEQGVGLYACSGLRRPWSAAWPLLEHP